ncbi:protein DGS1, mitochondrial isoform X2 [Euphorbia lathyris]|uniref:protein DGS1, mitochondrial isoform X2 n=1 Tax=Euphorbia lathyris TaxID=212925 RepID=UPI0033137330
MEMVEDHSAQQDPKGVKALVSFYSNYLWNRLASLLPHSDSTFLGRISKLSRQTARATSRRRRSACLPLPLPSYSPKSPLVVKNLSGIYDVLEDMMDSILLNLHNVETNLHFWESRAKGSGSRKLYFIFFERGPLAFIDGTAQLLHECLSKAPSVQHICQYASSFISERVDVLTHLRRSLATFLAEVYMEVEKCGEELVKNPERSLPSLLAAINGLFLDLEASIGHIHADRQTDSSVDGSYSMPLLFEKLPEPNQKDTNWADCEIADAVNLVNKNLQKLDSYLSLVVAKHQKPKKITRYWIRYTCGAVGLSVCSMWLLRHSSVMGSSDIDNWIHKAKDSTFSFFSEHVEQPLLSIRDELFDTFRKRHEGKMEIEEVQSTANSLHRMLLEFSEQTKGQKFPENASDHEMLEMVMARYEKELVHPIQNLVSGELGRALLIQVQKLKLDIKTAMLELDQIVRANQINFAVLAALPAFFLSVILFMVTRAWFKRDTRAQGRGRIARHQRRLLLGDIDRQIVQYQISIDNGLEKESHFWFGLMLYYIDRLSHAVKWHAQETGEWPRVRQDIIGLGKPSLQTTYKLTATSRMRKDYACLARPSLKRH